MKLVIECEGVKRELAGPFGLCASRQDLATLRDQLNAVLADDEKFIFGWLTIWPAYTHAEHSTKPLPWVAGAPQPEKLL